MNSVLYPTELAPFDRHYDSLLVCMLGFCSAENNANGEMMHTKVLSQYAGGRWDPGVDP